MYSHNKIRHKCFFFIFLNGREKKKNIRVKFQLQRRWRKNSFFSSECSLWSKWNLIALLNFCKLYESNICSCKKKVAIYWTLAHIAKLFSFVFISGVWIQWKSNGDELLFTYMNVFFVQHLRHIEYKSALALDHWTNITVYYYHYSHFFSFFFLPYMNFKYRHPY